MENYDYNIQTDKQFDSSYETEKKWRNYAPHFQSEMRDKQSKRGTPKNEFCQNVITSFFVLKNV